MGRYPPGPPPCPVRKNPNAIALAGPARRTGRRSPGTAPRRSRDAITRTITTLPEALRRSLTWDQGAEMTEHAQLRIDAGVPVYFCDPHSPWQRGTNENTNGLLRQYFPKGHRPERAWRRRPRGRSHGLNTRPRKTLGWRTPAEAFDAGAASGLSAGVATTSLNPGLHCRGREWWISPRGGRRRWMAMTRASTHSSALRWSAMDQPTISRVPMSLIAAR